MFLLYSTFCILLIAAETLLQILSLSLSHPVLILAAILIFLKVEIRRVKADDKEPRSNRRKSRDEEVEEMTGEDDHNYLFVCNRWLARDEDDGQIVRELAPMDASGKPRRGSLPGE